mgnify:CR=1 FL=1
MNRNIHRIGGALLLAAALPGCGGGGGGGGFYPSPIGGNNPPQNQPPAQADAYDLFIAYVQAMVATMLDSSEPANVAAFDPPPTSETKEPVATQ